MASGRDNKRGLGRGLSALMADVTEAEKPVQGGPAAELFVPIEQIEANPDQPRKQFVQGDLDDLAASIKEKGVIQPLIVRVLDSGRYQIVAGERRWRASQMAKLHKLPVVVRQFSDAEVLEVAIIENIQRADLNPMEEAVGYRQLMDRFGHTQEKMAEALGKSRSHIANLLRLLNLPSDVIELVRSGELSSGHARALVPAENASELAKLVIKSGLSVRATEALVKSSAGKGEPKSEENIFGGKPEKDADTKALEGDLSAGLRMKVLLNHKPGSENGQMFINYGSLDDLDELCRRLGGA